MNLAKTDPSANSTLNPTSHPGLSHRNVPNITTLLDTDNHQLHQAQFKRYLDKMADFELPAQLVQSTKYPLFNSKVPAGFPSPADDHVEKRLDTNDYLIDQADATFFVTIQGQSMIEVGLMPGDKAVVDRSKKPSIGDIVLAVLDGEFTIKTLAQKKDGSPRLLPANSTGAYAPIEIKEGMSFEIWGVVIGSFRRFK